MSLVEITQKKEVKALTRAWLWMLRKYFRVEVKGIEHIPKNGGVLIAANHSGFVGADAALLAFIIKRETRRRPRILAHRAYFDFSRRLKEISEGFGLKRAGVNTGIEVLKRRQVLIIFPEGEAGNFKPSLKRYELQSFHTGFLRMAVAAQVPIVPCLIVGAEESNLNVGNLDLSRFVKGLRIPLPVNWIPLPAKWRMTFLPPISMESLKADDATELKEKAGAIHKKMQVALRRQVKARKYVYFKQARAALKVARGIVGKNSKICAF